MKWDREKLPKPNLHMYGKDNTKIMVYNMKRWPKKEGWGNLEQKRLRKYITKRRTLDS